jgi:hypothetical protein
MTQHQRQNDLNETQEFHLVKPPCAWATVLSWALGIAGAIAVFLFVQMSGHVAKAGEKMEGVQYQITELQKAQVGNQRDTEYIKQSLTRIEKILEKK